MTHDEAVLPSDGELIARCLRDDTTAAEAAFAAIVARHGAMVHARCRRALGGDAAAADDAAQNTFVLLTRQLPRLRRGEALAGWLHRTAGGVCSHLRRSEERRRERERIAMARFAHLATTAAREPDLHDDPELLHLLDRAIARLRSTQRAVVVRHCLEGIPQAQVAAELGISVDAVKQRLRAALTSLRRHFARRGIPVTTALLAAVWPAMGAHASGVPTGAIDTKAVLARAGGLKAASAPSMAIPIVLVLAAAAAIGIGMALVDRFHRPAETTATATDIFFPDSIALYRETGFLADHRRLDVQRSLVAWSPAQLLQRFTVTGPARLRLDANAATPARIRCPETATIRLDVPAHAGHLRLRWTLQLHDPGAGVAITGPTFGGLELLDIDRPDWQARPQRDLHHAMRAEPQALQATFLVVGRMPDGRPVREVAYQIGDRPPYRAWYAGDLQHIAFTIRGELGLDALVIDAVRTDEPP